jgi:hypothetical protein
MRAALVTSGNQCAHESLSARARAQEQLSEKLYGALANSTEGGFHEHNT